MRLFVLACVLLGGMGQGVVAPRMPELLAGSSQLALASGISAALMYLGIFLSTFLYGSVADRGRVHWLLAPGLVAYAAITIGLGFCDSTPELFALRFLEGLALAAIYVAADFALGRLSSDGERGKWLSFYGVALSIGLILGPLLSLGAPEIARALGAAPELAEKPLLPLSVVAALALGLALFAWPRRVPAAESEGPAESALDPRPLIAGSVYGFMEAALVAVFPALAVSELHVVPEHCLLITILVAALFSVGWGELSDRVGAKPVSLILVATLALAPSALAFFGTRALEPELLAYASAALFGLIAGGLYPVGFSWLLTGLPRSRYGYASGAFARAYGAGSLAGPLAAGAVAERAGFFGLLLVLSVAGVLAAAAIAWAGSRAAAVDIRVR